MDCELKTYANYILKKSYANFDMNFIFCELPNNTIILNYENMENNNRLDELYNAVILHYNYLSYIYDNQRALNAPKFTELSNNIKTALLSYYIDNKDFNTEPIWEKVLLNDWKAFEEHLASSNKNSNLRSKELQLLNNTYTTYSCKKMNIDIYNLTNDIFTYESLLDYLEKRKDKVFDFNNYNTTDILFEIEFNESNKWNDNNVLYAAHNLTSLYDILVDICPENINIHNHADMILNQDIAGLALWAFILVIVFPVFFMTFCTIVLCKWCCPTVCFERHYHHPGHILIDRGDNFNM
jgi:hypothetical protein